VFLAGHASGWRFRAATFRVRPQSEHRRAVEEEKNLRKAVQTVFHDRDRHSYVLLPVVPAAAQLTSAHPSRYVTKRVPIRRGSQVVRQGSAKPLFVGSIPTRASRRYTGFRISDAAFFSIDKLEGTHAFLYMTKTGDPVYVPLPDFVVRALKALPLVREKYFFMTGRGSERLESITDVWRKKLKRVFQVAGPFTSTPHPHRFRHTFACDLLQKGVPVDDVAILLGHSDPRITLRHYARWIKGRQDRLDNLVKEAWKADAAHFQIVPRSKKSA
jgi:integrase